MTNDQTAKRLLSYVCSAIASGNYYYECNEPAVRYWQTFILKKHCRQCTNKRFLFFFSVWQECWQVHRWRQTTGAALIENTEASAKLTTANGGTFTWAQPDSVANNVTARSICDWRALTWLATATGWTQRKRFAICSGELISVHMIWYDVNRRYGI